MDTLRFLEDLYKYCQINDLQFSSFTIKQQKQHIKIMLKKIVQNYH